MGHFPARLLSDGAPILPAARSVHAIAKETRDNHPRGLGLWQAPLGGEIPILLPRSRLLLAFRGADDSRMEQGGDGLQRHQAGKQRDQARARDSLHGVSRRRTFATKRKDHRERSHAQTEDHPDVRAFLQPETDAQSGEHEMRVLEPALAPRAAHDGGEREKHGAKSHRARAQAPADIGKHVHVQRGRDGPQRANRQVEPQLPQKNENRNSEKQECQRTVKFGEPNRLQNRKQKKSEVRHGAATVHADPIEVLPDAGETIGQFERFGLQRGERAVVREEGLAGLKAGAKEEAQNEHQGDEGEPKTIAARGRQNRRGAFRRHKVRRTRFQTAGVFIRSSGEYEPKPRKGQRVTSNRDGKPRRAFDMTRRFH